MSSESVTHWLEQLKAGSSLAAQQLWEAYFRRLVALARQKLRCSPRRVADEEDVALSAFDSFCRAAERGRFAQLTDRNDLWQLLVLLTARKANRLRQYEQRLKRGGGQAHQTDEDILAQIMGSEPTPELAAQVAEECQRLLGLLGDSELRMIALAKMEGCTNEEMAQRLDCAPRTIERKLRRIRSLWSVEEQT